MAHVANVTVNSSQVSADHTDFVVYVDLSGLPTTEFWGTVANGGGDIRCYKSDGTTELAREVVSCDTATDTGELHVKYAGTLSSSIDTEIQIWTDEGTEPAVTATYGRNAVWGDYAAVYHGSSLVDVTGNGNTLTNNGATVSTLEGFGTAGSWDFADTEKDYLEASDSASLSLTSSVMMTAWLNPESPATGAAGILAKYRSATGNLNQRSFEIFNGSGGSGLELGMAWSSTGNFETNNQLTTGAASLSVATWGYVAGTIDPGTSAYIYLNGSQVASKTATFTGTSFADTTAPFWVGAQFDVSTSNNQFFDGRIGERRLREVPTNSADWIADEYTNQNTPATFYTVAAVAGAAPTLSATSASSITETSITPNTTLTF